MHNIYIKIHRYDAGQNGVDGYSVTELSWVAKDPLDLDTPAHYERTRVEGIWDEAQAEEFLGKLVLDEPVEVDSILVHEELRQFIASCIIPLEWQRRFLEDDNLLKRVKVYFSTESPMPRSDVSSLYDHVYWLAHNTSFDTRPTMMFGGGEQQMYDQFCNYLDRIADSSKSSALLTLENYNRANS